MQFLNMKRSYNPKNVRRKSNEKRTYNKPSLIKKNEEPKAGKATSESDRKLTKSKKDK